MRYQPLRMIDGPTSPAAARLMSASESVQVGQHEGGVAYDVIDVIRAADHAFGIDEERVSEWVVHVWPTGPDHAVGRTDRVVDVGQQGERESLGLAEGAIFLRAVERRSEDGAVAVGKRFGTVTQCLALERSTRSRRLRVPPEE